MTVAEYENGPVEQRLLRQVAGIIQRCENQLLSDFYQGSDPTSLQSPTRATPPVNMVMGAPHIRVSPTPLRPTDIQYLPNLTISRSAPTAMGLTANGTTQPTTIAVQHAQHSDRSNYQYTAVQFDQCSPMPWASSEYIDWNAIFPPGTEPHDSESDTHPVNFTMPVWT